MSAEDQYQVLVWHSLSWLSSISLVPDQLVFMFQLVTYSYTNHVNNDRHGHMKGLQVVQWDRKVKA